ncbi:hypothetical protein E2K80_18855 [Rhodophyticola sp. CCM32]|nr:hypothetical protein E2K80_18855 [Rhodophyticola sp. CCM32]
MLYLSLILTGGAILALLAMARSCLVPSQLDLTDRRRWRSDPLSHPAIRRMSLREVADLPFDPSKIASE